MFEWELIRLVSGPPPCGDLEAEQGFSITSSKKGHKEVSHPLMCLARDCETKEMGKDVALVKETTRLV